MEVEARISELVLNVHRRNGGTLDRVEPAWRLLEPALRIDSLDLAEIMVAVERESGCSPFDAPKPPRTWEELAMVVADGMRRRVGSPAKPI